MPQKFGTKRKAYVKYNCAHCGKEWEVMPCVIKGKKNLFCRGNNRACQHAYQASGKAKLPKGSFMLRPDAAAITTAAKEMVAAGKSGPQIREALSITGGEWNGIVRREGIKIKNNLNPTFGENNPKWVGWHYFNCATCGIRHRAKPYNCVGKANLYCSTACQHKGLILAEGEHHDSWTGFKKEVCRGCDETFKIRPWIQQTFCDRDCYEQWQSQQTGPLHPNYKENANRKRGASFSLARKKAIRRDAGTCQLCQTYIGASIQVHHIKPYRLWAEEEESKANALKNLVCLCSRCHKTVEGHTNDADINNWRERFEINRHAIAGKIRNAAEAHGAGMRADYSSGEFTTGQILKKYLVSQNVFNFAVLGIAPERKKASSRFQTTAGFL